MTLRVKNLRVSYGRMLAVKNVSLEVEPGKLIAIVGANGAGKSTTLRAISGLLRPSEGSIELASASLVGLGPHTIARRGVVHVPEGRGLLPGLTVMENLRLGEYGHNRTGAGKMTRDRVLELFPSLRERLNAPAAVLSGGEQQMLSIARVLLKSPRILMIDEMSLGLAPKLVQQILEVVMELVRTGIGVLCVEQSTKLILRHAHYAYVMETGQTVLEGTGPDLLSDETVVRSYLGHTAA